MFIHADSRMPIAATLKHISGHPSVTEEKRGDGARRFGETIFSVRYWDETTFYLRSREWNALLKESDCDPLFMSWQWHRAWWLQYKSDGAELCIIAVYGAGVLLALAPMYLEKSSYFNGLLPVHRLQFIGKRFRGASGIRAEYMNFIVRKNCPVDVLPVLVEAICEDDRWNELVLEDMSIDQAANSCISSIFRARGCHLHFDGCEPTYVVDCTTPFDTYLANLGRNSRLRLYGRRKLLERMAPVTLEPLTATNRQEFFEVINRWHRQRWGESLFAGPMLRFIDAVFSLEPPGMSLAHSSMLKLDGRPISAILNAVVESRIYNIQIGYIENFDKRISLGTLHLGYQLEAAFEDKAVRQFDLLAGQGKNANYKSRLAEERPVLCSMRWCRSSLLKLLFTLYEKMK